MNKEEKQKLFNYIRENVPYYLKLDDEINDCIIDFKNDTYFCITDIDDLYESYLKLDEIINDFIKDNNLDNVNNYDYIVHHFHKYKDYFKLDQACLIELEDLALNKVISVAKNGYK